MKSIGILIFFFLISTIVIAQNLRTVFDDVQYKVEPVGLINTVASDISPMFINDSIYFSSMAEKYFRKIKKEKRKTGFYNIYSASINKRGIISSSRKLVPEFGNEYHEGPADYCEATGELFLTVNNTEDYDQVQKMVPIENIQLQLIILKKIDEKWQIVEKLPFNQKHFQFAQPTISITGDTLVFVSDLNTVNYGKTDLFMSIRKNGKWSSPINLGNKVNTQGNELFPNFITGNILSFASNGHKINKGGLDIYYSDFPLLNKVKNLSYPINSPFDDFALKIFTNRNVGYFVSNRNTKSNDDIFRLDIQKLYINFNGKVLDFDSRTPIANAKIIFTNCNGDTLNNQFTDSIGSFSYEMMNSDCIKVEIQKDGYTGTFKNISGLDNLDFKLKLQQFYEILVLNAETNFPVDDVLISNKKDLNLTTNKLGIVSIIPPLPDSCEFIIEKAGYLNQKLKPKSIEQSILTRDTVYYFEKKLELVFFKRNVFTPSGELKVLQEVNPIYDQVTELLKQNPDLIVELGWHSDSRGSIEGNEKLTRNRAAFAVRYIENNGIEKHKVIGKGYGESQLINNCTDGVECSEEEHAENRRIELKIIGFVKPQTVKPEEE